MAIASQAMIVVEPPMGAAMGKSLSPKKARIVRSPAKSAVPRASRAALSWASRT